MTSNLDSFRDSLPHPAPGSGLGERFMDDPDGGSALDRDAHHGGHVLPQVLGVLLQTKSGLIMIRIRATKNNKSETTNFIHPYIHLVCWALS